MEKVYISSSSCGKVNLGWLNANYSFSYTNYTIPDALNYLDSMCLGMTVRFSGFG